MARIDQSCLSKAPSLELAGAADAADAADASAAARLSDLLLLFVRSHGLHVKVFAPPRHVVVGVRVTNEKGNEVLST